MFIGVHVSLGRTQHNETLAVPDEEPAKALARREISFFPLRVPSSDLPGRVIADLIRCNRGRWTLRGHAQQQAGVLLDRGTLGVLGTAACYQTLPDAGLLIFKQPPTSFQTIPKQWTQSPRPRQRKVIVSDRKSCTLKKPTVTLETCWNELPASYGGGKNIDVLSNHH